MKAKYVIFGVLLLMLGAARVVYGVDISAAIPGTNSITTQTPPSAFVANFYNYALSISGILAFGVIVYGGIKYMVSAGNPSGQGDAKEWIKSAIMGLLLLAGAYMVLNIINPGLVNMGLPSLPEVSPPPTSSQAPSQASTGNNGTNNQNSGGSGWTCQLSSNGGTSGSCPAGPNGAAQNCCDVGGAAVCQTNSCPALVLCGGTQMGFCPNNKTCTQMTIGLSGGGTYACQ